VEKTGIKRPWKSLRDFHFSHSSNNNKVDDRDHFQQNAKTSVASLRGLIGSSRNIDRHQSGMLIAFTGIPTQSGLRLKTAGWLELETGKGRWKPNRYFVLLEKLPLEEELRRTVVSPEAEKLARDYVTEQRRAKPGRIFRKGTQQRYAYRLQTLIDKAGGDEPLVRLKIRFALRSPKYRAAALRGPHVIRRSWKSLTADYETALKTAAAAEIQQPANPAAA
jgi:hypothetical protein